MNERHDSGYRLLFSHPRMVRDLLRGFIPVPEVENPAGLFLERRSGSHTSQSYDRREQDMVWRLRRTGSPDLYLLLEFQSQVDSRMDVRTATYRGLFCEGLIRTGEWPRGAGLPLVLPAVVYNGRGYWRAAGAVDRSMGWDGSLGWTSYLLIDALREPLEDVEPENLVRLLFELERSRTPAEIDRHVGRLAQLLAGPEDADLRRAFTAFLSQSLIPGRFPGSVILALQDLEEIRPMLRETVIEWTHQWLEEGRSRGIEEGRTRGIEEGIRLGHQQGEAALFLRLLEKRFGPVDPRLRSRIESARSEQLEAWGELLLGARSVQEIFGH
jgi:hypothetical protein